MGLLCITRFSGLASSELEQLCRHLEILGNVDRSSDGAGCLVFGREEGMVHLADIKFQSGTQMISGLTVFEAKDRQQLNIAHYQFSPASKDVDYALVASGLRQHTDEGNMTSSNFSWAVVTSSQQVKESSLLESDGIYRHESLLTWQYASQSKRSIIYAPIAIPIRGFSIALERISTETVAVDEANKLMDKAVSLGLAITNEHSFRNSTHAEQK